MTELPDYHCRVCGTLSQMVLNDVQAFCTNRESCNVLMFNPSLPDGGMGNPQIIDLENREDR